MEKHHYLMREDLLFSLTESVGVSIFRLFDLVDTFSTDESSDVWIVGVVFFGW